MPAIRICYQTIEFDDIDIHLCCLKDKQQFSDPFGEAESIGISSAQWPLFGVIWESSEILAQKMQHYEIEGKRILELGCGIGLSSLLLNTRHADITATDYHPEAGKFLAKNSALNNSDDIPFLRIDWKDENLGLGKFDLIIGSDLLYETNHIELLSCFIDRHSEPKCEVIMVDPGRGNHAQFSKCMVKLGFEHSQYKPSETEPKNTDFKGVVLKYQRH